LLDKVIFTFKIKWEGRSVYLTQVFRL
jgi:hypothetical protein